jgi:virulence factor Mce-like protein
MIDTQRLKLDLRRSWRPFAMYVAMAVAAITIAVLLSRNLTFERPWDSYVTVRAAFSDVKGIVPSKDPVRISGVNVGVVSGAQVNGGEAVLTLQIQKQYGPVYRNAQLRIRPVTPLDDLYVDITDRGTAAAGVAGSNYTIPVTQTITPVDISRVLDAFDAPTRERLTILLSELGRGLQDNGAQLREAFVQLAPFLTVAQQATQALAIRQREVRELVHNFGGLTVALDERNLQLSTLLRSGDATLSRLESVDQPLGATLSELPGALQAMQSSFARVSRLTNALDPALSALEPVATRLDSGLVGLASFGRAATPALEALRPAISSLEPLARTLVPSAGALDSAFTRLRPQAPQFDAITNDAALCRQTLGTFFNNTLQVFKFADANGSFPRAQLTEDSDALQFGQPAAGGLNLHPLSECTDAIGGQP